MTLESTVICVDNSEYCRNGDYAPTRLLAQRDAINMVARYLGTGLYIVLMMILELNCDKMPRIPALF